MTTDELNIKAAAQVLGQQAFVNGKMRVFALDQKAVSLLAGNKIGQGLPIIKAWIRGWDEANLCGDIQ